MNEKTIKLKYWIKSNRGTKGSAVVTVPRGLSKEEKKEYLEEWCSQFGAWHHSDNIVHYGWKYVKK